MFKYLLIFLLLAAPVFAKIHYDDIGRPDYDQINHGIERAFDKVYIDEEELNMDEDAFYFHVGGNVWIHTDTVHRDKTGLFTFNCSISKPNMARPSDYERRWKCPYCYSYWPIGTPCQNKDCPSKYK